MDYFFFTAYFSPLSLFPPVLMKDLRCFYFQKCCLIWWHILFLRYPAPAIIFPLIFYQPLFPSLWALEYFFFNAHHCLNTQIRQCIFQFQTDQYYLTHCKILPIMIILSKMLNYVKIINEYFNCTRPNLIFSPFSSST